MPTQRRRRGLPRKIQITREGKVFIGVTLGVGIAAINTGNNLLFLMLGLLLSIITLSGILSELALRDLVFERRLPRRAVAGTPMLVEIEVHNRKKRVPSYSIEVEDRIDERRTDKRCYFLKVGPGAKQTAAYRRTPPVRGPERYAALRVSTRFPFGLIEKWREIELASDQLVYPALARTARRTTPGLGDGETAERDGRGQGDVDGLRELRAGEAVRDVDWKKSAATGKLVARERRREGAHRLRIELDNRPPDDPAETSAFVARVEGEVQRAAFVCLDALRDGTTVELLARDGGNGTPRALRAPPGGDAVDRVLGFLARVPPVPGPNEVRAAVEALRSVS